MNLARDLVRRVARGEHIVLWGPRGGGKTTLLNTVRVKLGARPCGYSAVTRSLDDVTRALEQAYNDVATPARTRRGARSRLWRAADADPGVLLLDHVTRVPTAMKGWLRRLRGGVVGVVFAIDVDSPRERERMRALRIGSASVRLPPVASRVLARELARLSASSSVPELPTATRRTLVHAARGRPGWIAQCVALANQNRYWRNGSLMPHVLALDTEVRLRGVSLGLDRD